MLQPPWRIVCTADYIEDLVYVIHRDTIWDTIPVGRYPTGICYNLASNKLYTANWVGNSVSIIWCDSGRVKSTVAVGEAPEDVLSDSVLNRVYCLTRREVVVIDGRSDLVLCRIPESPYYWSDFMLLDQRNRRLYVPGCDSARVAGVLAIDAAACQPLAFISTMGSERPRTACWSSVRNKVYVANCVAPGNVAVIDGESNAVVGWVPTGMFPVAIAYNRDLDRVYTADSVSSSVTVIDCAADSAIASIRVGGRPTALLVLPDAGKVYCANKASNTVSVIDARSNSVAKTITTGGTYPCALAHSPGNNKVYCLNQGSSTITVVDLLSDSVIRLINTKMNPAALVCSPASNKLFCSHAWGDTALLIDCSNDSVIARLYIPKQYDLGYHPDNDWVYFSKLRYESAARATTTWA